ncbi:MAG: CinA family protein [Planctomycetaceae bacterium]|nr:CinA family protein [Planctomycetaceae bacterium]
MGLSAETSSLARQLAELLEESNEQLVFAESCTAGLASATLAGVPGISQHLCGSAVVYQIPTKVAWLDIAPDLIESHGYVSEEVATAMAKGVLRITPHATLSASITGDLGPDAPEATDGTAWIAVESRDSRSLRKKVDLPDSVSENQTDRELSLRLYRQRLAVEWLLKAVIEFLES